MTFPPYSEYKKSGVDWLGEVPANWQVLPCRAFVVEQTAKNDGAAVQNYLSLMANVGIIPYEEKGDVGNKKPEDLTKCKLVSKGDFVINSMNYGIGSYGLSDLDGVCSPVYIVLRPRLDRVEPRYASRIFENREFQTYAQSFGNGILEHRAAIGWDTIKGICVGIPPKEEQRAILMCLDRETAKIGALTAEQEKLIALLKEKRQALISHAVTKGLNHDAQMKDSGIEWLGQVPAHWKVLPLKHAVKYLEGPGIMAVDFGDDGVPLLRISCIGGRIASLDGCNFLDSEKVSKRWNHFRVKSGDLLISGSASSGFCTEVDETTEGAIPYTGIIIVRPRASTCAKDFARWFLLSNMFLTQIDLAKTGSTIQHYGPSHLSDMKIVCPPMSEQGRISAYLDDTTLRYDTLIFESQRTIDLLKERRSALISAAVTGKIDVRDFSKADVE